MVILMTSSSGTVSWRVLCLRWRDILSTCSVTYIECSSASRRTELCIYVEFTFNWEAVSQRSLSERFSWIAVRGKTKVCFLCWRPIEDLCCRCGLYTTVSFFVATVEMKRRIELRVWKFYKPLYWSWWPEMLGSAVAEVSFVDST